MSFLQYLKDTRGELRHVSWPTQMQTIVYTVLVIVLSLLVAVYLGFLDYVFTTGLARVIEFLPQSASTELLVPDLITAETTPIEGDTPASPTPVAPE